MDKDMDIGHDLSDYELMDQMFSSYWNIYYRTHECRKPEDYQISD